MSWQLFTTQSLQSIKKISILYKQLNVYSIVKVVFCALFYSFSSVKSLGDVKNTKTNVQCYRHLGHKLHSSFKDAVKMRSLGASLSCVVQKDQTALLPHLELCTFTSKASCVVGVLRDESFQGRDKGSARGRYWAIVAEFQHNGLAVDPTRRR